MNLNEIAKFYNGKTVLLTGHTGFKGSWLAIWLIEMGAKVIGVALDPKSEKDNFVLSGLTDKMIDIREDIRDIVKMKQLFKIYHPDIVFHLAAQPLVRLSYEKPVETYETNVMGTINIMESIRSVDSVKSAIMVTTDKCYENIERNYAYKETDPMGGYDPYSSSKGAVELAISSWRRSYNLPLASARAGNVVGGGDWAADRIIPDCIRAIEANKVIEIRSPKAIRPWEHVLEPLGAYLWLAYKLYNEPNKYNQSWNFGPEQESVLTVWEMAEMLVKYMKKGELENVSDTKNYHEANLLMLDISKAIIELNWRPRLTLEQTIDLTADWYKQYQNRNVYALCVEQIKSYLNE